MKYDAMGFLLGLFGQSAAASPPVVVADKRAVAPPPARPAVGRHHRCARTSPPSVTKTGETCRCGSHEMVDVPIHDGRSMRRDCAWCKRFVDFTVWYGKARGKTGSTEILANKSSIDYNEEDGEKAVTKNERPNPAGY